MKRAKRYAGLLVLILIGLAACTSSGSMPEPYRAVREISVTAWSWGYEPALIRATTGQRIRLKMSSLDVAHSLVNEGLHIDAAIPPRGSEPAFFDFTAPDAGEYVFRSTTASGPGVTHMQLRLVVMR